MFGENIKELRKERGMTQKELADEIGVSQGAVFFWEKEINEPTAGVLIKMAKFFGVSVDEILSVEKIPKSELPKEKLILEYFSRLTEEQQETIIKLIKDIAGA